MPTFRSVARIVHPSLGGIGTNTWHARVLAATDPLTGDLESATTIIEDFYTAVAGVLVDSARVEWGGLWQQVLSEDPETVQSTTFEVLGVGSPANLPPANAICVGWRSATGGRSGRGRTFLGPLSAGVTDSAGKLSGDTLTTVRAAAEGLVDDSESFGNGAICIYSAGSAGQSPKVPTARDITATATRDSVAVLRSRRD